MVLDDLRLAFDPLIMKHFENFTTHQLRTLVHLLKSRSVTMTAHAFETSQPAVSRLLAEMRQKFGNALLVRSGDGMVITDRGRMIRDEVERLLERMSRLIEPEPAFEPQSSNVTFSLGFTDSNMVTLVPPVVVAIKRAGANLRTHIHSIDTDFDVVGALENRDLDVVVDCVTKHTRSTYESLRFAPLGSDDVVLLVRKEHPIVSSPPQSFEDYGRLQHVAPFPISNAEKGPIDGALAALKTPRRIQSFIPEYNLIPHILLGSNLVFTTCRGFAGHYVRHLPLAVVPAPDFFPEMEFRLLWHEVTNQSPAKIWLRSTIQTAAKIGSSLDSPRVEDHNFRRM